VFTQVFFCVFAVSLLSPSDTKREGVGRAGMTGLHTSHDTDSPSAGVPSERRVCVVGPAGVLLQHALCDDLCRFVMTVRTTLKSPQNKIS